LDNQTPDGLILDRQSNGGPLRRHGLCSTTATGMGFFALALSSATPHSLMGAGHAAARIQLGVRTYLERLPRHDGVVPHFIDPTYHEVHGRDHFSTIETGWLVAGALWAATFLGDPWLEEQALQLYDRVNWRAWTAPESGLLYHGMDRNGRFLGYVWDRANGETAFMYVLAAGAEGDRCISAHTWSALDPGYGVVAGQRLNNADLGLFVFQYGFDLLDLCAWESPDRIDWMEEARLATAANHRTCQSLAETYATYRHYWGLSAGDGPGDADGTDVYRCYSPVGPIDGTAHLTATLASAALEPKLVLENLYRAQRDRQLGIRGRYGFSNLNLDRSWVSRDMVGIDAGAAVLALDNLLMDNRVRDNFMKLPSVQRGLARLGFRRRAPVSAHTIPANSLETRLAS
jgi:hypothetical protein